MSRSARDKLRPVRGVADGEPERRDLVAEAVGALEVAGGARLLALPRQPLGLRVRRRLGARQRAEADELEHLLERGVRAAQWPPVALGDELVELRHRARGVEVLREGIEERLPPLARNGIGVAVDPLRGAEE